MTDLDCFIISTPIQPLKIYCRGDRTVRLTFVADETTEDRHTLPPRLAPLAEWLTAYFDKQAVLINLIPLEPAPTAFSKRLRDFLLQTHFGEVFTYKQVAEALDSHPRAVGQACRRNPLPLIVPCHRVVAQHDIGGYMGAAEGAKLDIKRQLLAFEAGQGSDPE